MIISRTPYRVSFLGGGTDYPDWYRQHGGAVLASTIDKYVYLTCRYLPPFFEHRFRVVYSKIEACQAIDEITHPVVREILRYLEINRGVEIHHDGDLPARSGMGTSSSFTVGLLHVLHALKGEMKSKRQLAVESIHVEQDLLNESVGSQDQVLAAYGGFNKVTFLPNDEFTVMPVTIPMSRLNELDSHLMLFYTGIKRTASNIASSYDFKSNKRQLRIMGELVEEGVSILNGHHDLVEFGELLHEAWQLKRGLSAKISNNEIDTLYEKAIAAGAVGGKITGAGGGGFMLLFAPPDKQKQLKEALSMMLHIPFRFEFSGSRIIFLDREQEYIEEEELRSKNTPVVFKELTS